MKQLFEGIGPQGAQNFDSQGKGKKQCETYYNPSFRPGKRQRIQDLKEDMYIMRRKMLRHIHIYMYIYICMRV